MTRPSAHLTWDELACKDGTPYPKKWRKGRLLVLTEVFELIRWQVDSPVKIGSAYRTPTHNNNVKKSAKLSQHTLGRALDLHTPKDYTLSQFHETIRVIASNYPAIGGLGYYRWGVHIDIRKRVNGHLVAWNGGKATLKA